MSIDLETLQASHQENGKLDISDSDFQKGAIGLIENGLIKIRGAFCLRDLEAINLEVMRHSNEQPNSGMLNLKISKELYLPEVHANHVVMNFVLCFFPDLYFILSGFCVKQVLFSQAKTDFDPGTMDLFATDELDQEGQIPIHEMFFFIGLDKGETATSVIDYFPGSHKQTHKDRHKLIEQENYETANIKFGDCVVADSRVAHRIRLNETFNKGRVLVIRYSLPWFYDLQSPKKFPAVCIDDEVFENMKMSHQLIMSHARGKIEWRHDRW